MTWKIINSDAITALAEIDAESVQCCITSPPYWGLRDYNIDGQFGMENTPQEYVDDIISVFRKVHDVLRPDGTLWLNLGDSYASKEKGPGGSSVKQSRNKISRHRTVKFNHGLKPKDLVGIPWRVAFALQADGWYLRSDIIWHKPNPMPESVTDRPTKSHEYIFLLSKSERYFYNAEAIKERAICQGEIRKASGKEAKDAKGGSNKIDRRTAKGFTQHDTVINRRNKRSVWTIPTKPYPEMHFATFPMLLPETCLLAGSKPGDLVIDPFVGSGTTGVAALKHGRRFVGIDINAEYAAMARKRIDKSTLQRDLFVASN